MKARKLLRSVMGTLGLIMMGVGIGVIVAAIALYAYGQYERLVYQSQLLAPVAASSLEPTMPQALITPTATDPVATPDETIGSISMPTPTPSPTPLPLASRITIPAMDLDSVVVEAKIENGEWQVPKFVVGHLQGTANPGQNGNVALSGHIESISSGNVFARLNELKPGDSVTLYAGEIQLEYKVSETKVVGNRDFSVVAPTREPILTLITCTGTFDYLAREYDHRLIVIAKPVERPLPRNIL